MRTLVAGIGSPILTDDGVGVHAARAFRAVVEAEGIADVDVIEVGTAGLSLLDDLEGYDRLILLDAILTGAKPGTLHVLGEADAARTAHLGAGHEADLPTVLAIGRRTLDGHMPDEVIVVAVEAKDLTTFAETCTPEVERAVERVLRQVLALVS